MKAASHSALRAGPLLLAAVVGLGVTLRAPLGTTVIGLIVFGVLHNLFELRYLAGRFVLGRLSSRLAWLLAAPILAVVLVRASTGLGLSPAVARQAEIALVYGSLGLAALTADRPAPLRAGLVAIVAIAGAASWTWVSSHYLILVHLHNLMPIVFLWLHRAENRGAVLAACAVWGLLIPAALLSGVLDPLLDFSAALSAGPVGPEEAARLRGGWSTPTTMPDQVTRIAATFSFLQWMHYFIWIFYLPRFSSPPTETHRLWRHFFGPVGFGVALVATVALVPLYLSDYIRGFTTYGTLAAFHALVEFPVLLAVLLLPASEAEARADEAVLTRDSAL